MKTKLTTVLLLLCAALLLSACGEGAAAAESASETQSAEAVTEAETALQPPDLSDLKLEGQTFSVVYRLGAGSYDCDDIVSEGLNGEPVNDAVYTRNRTLEDNLGVTMNCVSNISPASLVQNLAMSGDDEFDAAIDSMNKTFPLATTGCFHNWRSLSYYDPDDVWWDSNADEALSVGEYSFIAVGDCSMETSADARFIYFNKGICELYNMELPYEAVRNGTWTMDVFIEMMSQVAEDLNGDGKMDGHDRFGLLSETSTFFISGGDVPFTTKDEDNYPVLSFMSDRTVDVVEKVTQIMNDQTHALSYDRAAAGMDTSAYSHIFDFGRSLFADGHFLFVQNGAGEAWMFVDMEDPYGVLPNPKYDVSQKEYHHLMDPFACAWVMPASVKDTDKSSALMSYWCWLSADTLVDAFYETTIKYKRLNAPEDADMLDIIRATIRYEISTLDDMGIMSILTAAGNSKGLSSTYTKSEKSINRKLETLIKKFEKLK